MSRSSEATMPKKGFDVSASLPWVSLLGRILLSYIFAWSVVGDLTGWAGTTHYMASHGIPIPGLFLAGADILKIVGVVLLVLGFRARFGALCLLVFIIPATFIFHNFWAITGAGHLDAVLHFQKNLAIMGGLLMVIALGPGRWSISS
ncbi:MAG: DoxX family protein [Acidobacteriota bacterium]|jgi:putative oxidoreductase